MKSYQESRRINTILVYAMLGAGAVLMIFPFLWMLLTSINRTPFHKTVYQHRPSDPFQGNLRSGILIRGRICICQA